MLHQDKICQVILKFSDLYTFEIAKLMFQFTRDFPPDVFESYFQDCNDMHSYSTRLASEGSYFLPRAKIL